MFLRGIRAEVLLCGAVATALLAQTEGKSASEVRAIVEADLHEVPNDPGSTVRSEASAPKEGVSLSTIPVPGGTVSAVTLRHKIPKKATKAFEKAAALSRAGRYQQAIGELQLAVKLDPEFAQAHGNLGVQYARLGRYADAEAELERSVALDPASAEAYSNLAWAQLQSGKTSAAEATARRALEISSGSNQARYLLGLALIRRPEAREEGIRQLEIAARSVAAAARVLSELGWK